MANPSKAKGDRAELEVQAILRDELGVPARRALGAGRLDDMGDIHGVPGTVIQVASWKDVAQAMRAKPLEAEIQRLRSHSEPTVGPSGLTIAYGITPFAAAFLRIKSTPTKVTETAYPNWRVVQTVEQWATLWREAQ